MKYLFIIILFLSFNVYATGGTLKQNSIIECNGEYFGNHGTPVHWHKAKKVNDKWVSDGEEIDIPSCYIKPINTFEEVTLASCVDGDTAKFMINKKEETVRFLAINTPETNPIEPFGKEAKEFTCNTLKNAKKIVLEYDGASDKKDKYGRILAFVYADDKMLEKELLTRGYAKIAYIYGDYEHLDELRKIENVAKENKLGVWQDNLGDIPEEKEEKDEFYDLLYKVLKIIVKYFLKIFA